ncbi:MAG: ABC transporter permease [Defluviitaleaceae bacterium]|nr:ABC transporter permease [Defluviitaleaceae bacterium]
MFNLMRADAYRMQRGKGIYIVLGIMLLIAALTIFVFRSALIMGVQTEAPEIVDGEINLFVQQEVITAADGAQMALASMDIMMYFILPIVLILAMAPFSSSAVKNELTIGFSRAKFYFSKLLFACTLSVLFMVVNIALYILFGTVSDGWGYWGSGLGIEVLQIFGSQVLFALAFNSIGVFMCFVFRKSGVAIGLYIAFTLVPQMVIGLLSIAFPEALRAMYFDLASLFGIFAGMPTMQSADIIQGLLIGLAWLVVPTVAGLAIFQRAEIK